MASIDPALLAPVQHPVCTAPPLKPRTGKGRAVRSHRRLVRSRKPGPQVDTYRARKVEIMEIHL